MPSVVRPLPRLLPLAAVLPAAFLLACSTPTEPTAAAQSQAKSDANPPPTPSGARPVPLPKGDCYGTTACWGPVVPSTPN